MFRAVTNFNVVICNALSFSEYYLAMAQYFTWRAFQNCQFQVLKVPKTGDVTSATEISSQSLVEMVLPIHNLADPSTVEMLSLAETLKPIIKLEKYDPNRNRDKWRVLNWIRDSVEPDIPRSNLKGKFSAIAHYLWRLYLNPWWHLAVRTQNGETPPIITGYFLSYQTMLFILQFRVFDAFYPTKSMRDKEQINHI